MGTKIVFDNEKNRVTLVQLQPGQVFSFCSGSYRDSVASLDRIYVMMQSNRVCCLTDGALTNVCDHGADREDLVLYHTIKVIK